MRDKQDCFFNAGIVFMMTALVFLLFAMGWQYFAGAMFDELMLSPENHDYAIRMTLSLLLHVPDGIARLMSACLAVVGGGICCSKLAGERIRLMSIQRDEKKMRSYQGSGEAGRRGGKEQ